MAVESGRGLLLVDDFMEAASDLSPSTKFEEDDLGLSRDLDGIFDLIELRRDRVESFVSDLEKEGYESSDGPSFESVLFSAFEG